MDRITIASVFADSEKLSGQTVTVMGWARTIRDMKTFGFVELNDGSCFKNLQIVLDANVLDNYKEITGQNVGAALIVTGTVVLTPEAKQPLEIKAASVAVEGVSAPDYPLQKKRHTVEYLRTIQHLRPRTNLFSAAFRVRSVAAHAIHCFFQDRGFVYVHTPIITASDCEGAGEMFQVTTLDVNNPPRLPDGSVDWSQDFFGKKANLTVSGQLNAENFAMAFGSVYTFGPTFRAENSNTQRHAAEFWMIEPEIAFADLGDDMDLAEDMIRYIIRTVLENRDFEEEQRQVRLQGGVGLRLADRARAVPHRAGVQEARVRHRLPQGHQGLLHAPQRRRQDRGRCRLPGARYRRDHRRLSA